MFAEFATFRVFYARTGLSLRILMTLSICVWQVDDFVQATAVVSLCKQRDGEPFASVGGCEIEHGAGGDAPARIDRAGTLIVVAPGILDIYRRRGAGRLVEVA